MEFKEQLKSSIDIVKVIGDYVRLKRLGSTGRYVGLCPFHQEKTPSFSVNQSRQFYKCFGCGEGGDAFTFVMKVDGLTFPETLKYLAERNGIPMPPRTEYADAESKLRSALHEINTIAAEFFQASLRGPQGAETRAYLDRRGVSAELIEMFGLGFAEPSGQALIRRLAQERFTQEQIDSSRLISKREDGSGTYDFFRGRLMFPIHNESGKVIAFGGRAMREDDERKYMNSAETPIYRKASVLYNLHRARESMRRSNRVVLVEGYMDVIGVYSAGIKEVVAPCGTSLTDGQVRVMHRHSDSVVVNFDPDTAGANAAEKAIALFLQEGMHVRVLALDGGLDPDEYVKEKGVEAYRAKLDSASTYFHWLADRAREKFDMRSAEGRMDAFNFLLPSVQKLSDKLERAAVANDLAGYLGVDASLVLEQFKKAAAERRDPAPRAAAPSSVPPNERMLLNALIASAEARAEVLPRLTEPLMEGFVAREIVNAIRHLEAAGSPVMFSQIDERLAAPAQALLYEVVAADEMSDEGLHLEQAKACFRRIETDFKKRQVGQMRLRVKTAEREGRIQEALELLAELSRLEKEISGAGGD